MPPRDSLREPFRGYPAVGAVHPVIANEALRTMLNDIASVADEVFERPYIEHNAPIQYEIGNHDPEDPAVEDLEAKLRIYNPAKYYRLFDAQTLGLSVLEMDLPARIADKTRTVWQRSDLGAVRQDIEQEAARHVPDGHLQLVASSVKAVGGRLPMAPKEPVRAKLAFEFDSSAYDETLDLIFKEHDIASQAIGARLNKRRGIHQQIPIDFVPHVTFMAYKQHVEVRKVAEVNGKVKELVEENPLVLRLGQLTTERSRLVR